MTPRPGKTWPPVPPPVNTMIFCVILDIIMQTIMSLASSQLRRVKNPSWPSPGAAFRVLFGTVFLAVFLFAAPQPVIAETNGAELLGGSSIPRGAFAVQARLPLPPDIAPSLRKILDSKEIALFLEKGELIYRHDEVFIPETFIGDAALAPTIARKHREKQNNFAIEILMALELPPAVKNSLSSDERELHIFNILHRMSTLSGLEYFSASRGRMREFYLRSAIVREADGTTVLPDPVFSYLLPSYRFILRQEDASFGDNLYEVRSSPGTLSIQNIGTMTYGIIPIAAAGDLELQLRIRQQGDYLLFYAFSSMKAPDLFGLREKVGNSFYNRMVALYNWFAAELEKNEALGR